MTLITEEYREQNRLLHEQMEAYGSSSHQYAHLVDELATAMGVDEVLDYGCGKQTLANALPQYKVHGYDPALPGLDTPPRPHDLVVCSDVLEHIEPELLDNVLDDLVRVTRNTIFLLVSTIPAMKTLPDGRNAHLIVKHRNWWLPHLIKRWNIEHFANSEEKAFIAVMSKKDLEVVS